MKISGSYIPAKWNESTYGEVSTGKKSTKISAEFQFHGDIEGIAEVEYLMFYTSFDESDMHKSEATYVGQMRIEGTLQGKHGNFIVHDRGTFTDGVAKSTLKIIEGSGTKELSTISGIGSYSADSDGCTWELDCEY